LTFFGLAQIEWPSVLPWASKEVFIEFLIILGFLFTGFLLAGIVFGITSTASFVLAVCLISFGSGNIGALFIVLLFLLSSLVLGDFLTGLFSAENGYSSNVNRFLIGAGAFGVIIGLLAHVPVNYPATYAALLLAPLLFRRQVALDSLLAASRWLVGNRYKKRTLDFIGSLIAALASVHFLVALLPELGYDALALHLLVPSHLYLRNQWGFDPSLYALGLAPMLADWIFSLGYMLSGETGARLLNLVFTYVMALQGYQLASWLGGGKSAPKFAALLFLSTPLTFTETNSLHVEAVWGAFLIAGVVAFLRLSTVESANASRNLIAGCLFLAFAANAKAVTFSVLLALVPLIVWRMRYWFGKGMTQQVFLSLIVFVLVGSVPYVTAWIIADNPVFPFFNGIFKSPYFPEYNFDNPLFKMGLTWDFPYRVIFESQNYLEATIGAPGFQWLLLFPAMLFLLLLQRNLRALWLLAFVLISLAVIFHSQSYLRYVYPQFLLVSVLVSVSICSWPKTRSVLSSALVGTAALTVALNIMFFASATWTYRFIPWQVLIGGAQKMDFLEWRSPIRVAVEFVNLLNVQKSPVAYFTPDMFGAGLNAEALYCNWYNQAFLTSVEATNSTRDLVSVLQAYSSRFIILDTRWEPKRQYIEDASFELARFGHISIRQLKEEHW
jgi:hypothetical protein